MCMQVNVFASLRNSVPRRKKAPPRLLKFSPQRYFFTFTNPLIAKGRVGAIYRTGATGKVPGYQNLLVLL